MPRYNYAVPKQIPFSYVKFNGKNSKDIESFVGGSIVSTTEVKKKVKEIKIRIKKDYLTVSTGEYLIKSPKTKKLFKLSEKEFKYYFDKQKFERFYKQYWE